MARRQFTADTPNQRWVGDTTECVIGESSTLYLAAILDLFSRFVVGWAISDRHLTLKALEMAVTRRCPEIGLMFHSDQGCTFASEDYQVAMPRWSCSTTSKCSMTSAVGTRRSARSARPPSNVGTLTPRSQTVHGTGVCS